VARRRARTGAGSPGGIGRASDAPDGGSTTQAAPAHAGGQPAEATLFSVSSSFTAPRLIGMPTSDRYAPPMANFAATAETAASAVRFDPAPPDWVQPVTLAGSIVRLEPLALEHLDGLAEVAFDGDLWRWTMVDPRDRDDLRAWLDAALANAAKGSELPFATIERATGRPIGSTRFMSIVPEHRRLEIGWTWVGLEWHRHGANQEAKLLQLTHVFETLGANRVEFKTDSNNSRANPALAAIGATFEGTFRNHMILPGNRIRHSNYYAIAVEDWPAAKAKLQARVAGFTGR
jgi:RimJ/RimL family protein N-acetyltransferase